MAARKDDPSAVERSLEDFIARANTTLPAPEPEVAAALGARRRTRDKTDGTLVVLGSQKPLADVTEIVTRLPADEVAPRKRWTSLRFGLVAFVAGAVAVLVITRFLGGGPRPLPPVAPPPAAVVAPPPPIIVQPLPASEAPAPAPAPAPEPAAAVAPEPAPAAAAAPKPRAAHHAPGAKPTKPEKKSTGLVDPFAN